jgi:hypothetical protein
VKIRYSEFKFQTIQPIELSECLVFLGVITPNSLYFQACLKLYTSFKLYKNSIYRGSVLCKEYLGLSRSFVSETNEIQVTIQAWYTVRALKISV